MAVLATTKTKHGTAFSTKGLRFVYFAINHKAVFAIPIRLFHCFNCQDIALVLASPVIWLACDPGHIVSFEPVPVGWEVGLHIAVRDSYKQLKLAFPDLCCFPKGLLSPLVILHQSVPIFLCPAAEHNVVFAFRSRDNARAHRGGNGLDDFWRLAGVYFWRLYYQLFYVLRWGGDPASRFV